jgi:DNA-binding XRE family transcriptional regulator
MAALLNQLKRNRLEAGLSQQALADLAGISRQAYSALESGSEIGRASCRERVWLKV